MLMGFASCTRLAATASFLKSSCLQRSQPINIFMQLVPPALASQWPIRTHQRVEQRQQAYKNNTLGSFDSRQASSNVRRGAQCLPGLVNVTYQGRVEQRPDLASYWSAEPTAIPINPLGRWMAGDRFHFFYH